ncbi:MAG TPA: cation:proton antiporter [Geminicoccaceae bacterium]
MEEHLNLVPIALLLIGTVVGGLLLAGLRQPPLVGYIIAGAVFGPSGLGLIADRKIIDTFAELGVLVLLFVVGTHLSLRAFKNIYRTAIGAALIQILVSVALMLLLAQLFGWQYQRAIFYGFVLALSSTAVGIKILEDVGELRTETGRCAVGVLIAQDLAVVPMLIIIVGLSSEGGVEFAPLFLKLAVALAVLAVMIWWLSRRQRVHLPFRHLLVRYADLAPVAALALCVIGAAISNALELPASLGAFLAGLYVGNTTERALMIRAMEPIQSLLIMMFFLSIGLLIDLPFVSTHLGTVLLLIGLVFLLNSVINVLALRAVGEGWRIAFLAGFALAQVGEFAFVLSQTAVSNRLIGEEAQRIVVAVIAMTMIMSPLWLELARRLHALRPAPAEGLASVLARMWRDEERLLRVRSGRAVRQGTHIVQSLTNGLERALRSPRQEPGDAPAAEPAPVAERSGDIGKPP